MKNLVVNFKGYWLSFVVALIATGISAPAHAAYQMEVYGITNTGKAVELPNPVCVYDYSSLRLQADIIDPYTGHRFFLPDWKFTWALVRSSGYFDRYTPPGNYSGNGLFRQSTQFRNAIEVSMPMDLGYTGELQVSDGRTPARRLRLVNVGMSPGNARCQWADPEVYLSGYGDEDPQPFPVPIETPRPCRNTCIIDMKCTDGCPIGGVCDFTVPSYGPAYWHVRSCRW